MTPSDASSVSASANRDPHVYIVSLSTGSGDEAFMEFRQSQIELVKSLVRLGLDSFHSRRYKMLKLSRPDPGQLKVLSSLRSG